MNERSRESYRGTSLIARTFRTTVRGKAWCDGREIAAVEGLTETDVIAALRELVDEAVTVDTADASVPYPSDAAYEQAMQTHLKDLSDRFRLMLRAHYRARGRKMTLEGLSEAAACPSLRSAYQHYGKVGRMLGESMLFEPRAGKSGNPLWILVLAEDENPDVPEIERPWRMRPQVAAALKAVGVV